MTSFFQKTGYLTITIYFRDYHMHSGDKKGSTVLRGVSILALKCAVVMIQENVAVCINLHVELAIENDSNVLSSMQRLKNRSVYCQRLKTKVKAFNIAIAHCLKLILSKQKSCFNYTA